MIDMKAEKYMIFTEVRAAEPSPGNGVASVAAGLKIRYGFGAAGEEVQRMLDLGNGVERVRVKIEGESREVSFYPGRQLRLLDIKQKIKSLSFDR